MNHDVASALRYDELDDRPSGRRNAAVTRVRAATRYAASDDDLEGSAFSNRVA